MTERLTLEELASILAERGYGYAVKPIANHPELAGRTEIFAVRGRGESHYLGVTDAVLQQSADRFRQGWAYKRLGIAREDYLQRAADEIAHFVLENAGVDDQAYTPWSKEIVPRLLTRLLFELEEAGYLMNTPLIYGGQSKEED